MKFGKRLIEELMEPGWEPYYVDYHALKGLIVQAVAVRGSPDELVVVQAFYRRLANNLSNCNAFAMSVLSKAERERADIKQRVISLKHSSQVERELADQVLADFVDWAEDLQAILKFCIANRSAARKIVKKLEKNCSTNCAELAAQEAAGLTSKTPFAAVQERATDLVRCAKELELGVMVACTEHIARLRTFRTQRSVGLEQLKLRRVEQFERDLLRPFMRPKDISPLIYMRAAPVQLLAAAVAGAGLAEVVGLIARSGAAPPCLSRPVAASASAALTQGSILALTACMLVQHKLVAARLAPRKSGWVLHCISGLVGLAFLSMALRRVADPMVLAHDGAWTTYDDRADGMAERLGDEGLLCAAVAHLALETAVQLRFDLCTYWAKLVKLVAVVVLLAATLTYFAAPLLHETWGATIAEAGWGVAGHHLAVLAAWSASTRPARWVYAMFLPYFTSLAPEFRRVALDAQIRSGRQVERGPDGV